jgi:hypothetical protein
MRLLKVPTKDKNFDTQAWQWLTLKLVKQVGDVIEDYNRYEMMIYVMDSRSGLFGIYDDEIRWRKVL